VVYCAAGGFVCFSPVSAGIDQSICGCVPSWAVIYTNLYIYIYIYIYTLILKGSDDGIAVFLFLL
jgi:hypothetical protein